MVYSHDGVLLLTLILSILLVSWQSLLRMLDRSTVRTVWLENFLRLMKFASYGSDADE